MSNVVKAALLPCPFCGGQAQLRAGGPLMYYVDCGGCSAADGDCGYDHIVTKWNTRPLDAATRNAALDEAVSACKIQFLDFPISDEDTAYNEGVEACISIIEALKTP